MEYRREIDGLRALAVIPVILFHAGFSTFRGGFVGVDVFFVISGYLITQIILGELKTNQFSILQFYERRSRRILPALFFVLYTSAALAWLWLFPKDMHEFSQSLVAVLAFSSNILFWDTSGYFNTAAELIPLLHTWSLAVEEQYYLFFPWLLALLWRRGRTWVWGGLIGFALLSLAGSQWAVNAKPTAAFYLLPSRGWELLIGALCACHLDRQPVADVNKRLIWQELGAWLGLAMLVFATLSYSKSTPFPGVRALIPTLGTALIILYARPSNTLGQLIGNRVFVFLGLLSYSAYLWHQPIFVFAKHRSLDDLTSSSYLILIALSFVLAYLSWKLIETPFRNKQRFSRKTIFTAAVATSMPLLIFGLGGSYSNGYETRLPPEVRTMSHPMRGEIASCRWDQTSDPCPLGLSTQSPSIAMIGDSHTNMLRLRLSETLAQQGRAGVSYGRGWCAPLLDVASDDPYKNPICREFIRESFQRVLANPQIKQVILHAEWSNYTEGYRWGNQDISYYTDAQSIERSREENIRVVARGLERTLSALAAAGKQVILVKSVPEYDVYVSRLLAKRYWHDHELGIGSHAVNASHYQARNAAFETVLAASPHLSQLAVVEPFGVFCPPSSACETLEDKTPLYIDGSHLSYAGSVKLVDAIAKQWAVAPSGH